jgi:DNA-binding response OmpR family regulator
VSLQFSENTLRSPHAFVHFTPSEGKVLAALIDSGGNGLSISEIPKAIGHDVSDTSIHISQTHISKLKIKLALISENRLSISMDRELRRYFFLEI